MKRLILSTLMVLTLGAGASFVAPQTAKADAWDVRYNAYRNHWNDHRRWRSRYYQPYYHHHHHSHRNHSGYYHSYRPRYDSYYYSRPYGYRDYRSGGTVRVGPLQFHWR